MSSYGYSSPSQPSSVPSAPSTPSPPAQQVTYTPPAPTYIPTPTPSSTPTPTPPPPTTQVRVQTTPVTQPVLTGPFAIDGYYPLYTTKESAVAASPTPNETREGETTFGYHVHVLGGIEYYMPNGLGGPGSGQQFHGDYDRSIQPVLTGPFAIDGYYPLYTTKQSAIAASPTPNEAREGETTLGYHVHTLRGVKYYMPNGLGGPGSGQQFHGDYRSVTTKIIKPKEPEMSEGNRVFSLKDSSGNFSKYTKGEIFLHKGELYEVLFDAFAKLPTNTKFFKLLTGKTEINVIDGGEF